MIKATDKSSVVDIQEIRTNAMKFYIVGTSPLVPHAVSLKNRTQLLFPSQKKNAAQKASSMKHEPYEEFVDACYRFTDQENMPTRLYMPAGAFHSAIANVAIDMQNAKKSQIGRLTTVPGGKIAVWGTPMIWTTIVRSSDMARTPDVRTLPLLPEWCCEVTVQFIDSIIRPESIANLLGAAGVIIGIGDGRPEKGKLSMGQFRCCNEDDEQLLRIKQYGTAAQDAALSAPRPYDLETEKLLSWFDTERGKRAASPVQSKKTTEKGRDVNGRDKTFPVAAAT